MASRPGLLVLGDASDPLGQRLEAAARRQGIGVRRLSLEQMLHRLSVALHIDDQGAKVELWGPDWRVSGDELTGVLCTVDFVPASAFARFDRSDADYAARETHALWVAILAALRCPVVNPPAPDSLGGPFRPPSELMDLARRAGLRPVSVAFVESGRVAAQLEREGVWASYCDLSTGRESMTAPLEAGPVRVHESAPGERTWVCVLEDEPFVVGEATRPPDEVLAGLGRLQRSLGTTLGTYGLARDADGQWRLDAVLRRPSPAVVAALDDAFFDALARRLGSTRAGGSLPC